jgi:hypothetical protein
MTREVCPEIRRSTGMPCDYVAGHPPLVHCTWIAGWPQQWSNPPVSEAWTNRPLPHDNQHAPEALK